MKLHSAQFHPAAVAAFCVLFPAITQAHAQSAPAAAPSSTVTGSVTTPTTTSSATPSERAYPGRAYPGLNSVLWMSQAAEWRAACTQAYKLATLQLDAALRAPKWTAAVEQTGNYAKLPPAVIFDIDETLFDNAPYDALMVQAGKGYDPTSFMNWNESGRIRALSGSVSFAQAVARRGVTPFYITNRSAGEKAVTLRNLRRLGFPVRSDAQLLLKGAKPEWTSDKTFRRGFVAQRFRVLLLIGDDFNDFLSAPATSTTQQRLQLKARYDAYWGDKWIIIPNPHYGSWERAITQGKAGAEAVSRKLDALAVAAAPATGVSSAASPTASQ